LRNSKRISFERIGHRIFSLDVFVVGNGLLKNMNEKSGVMEAKEVISANF